MIPRIVSECVVILNSLLDILEVKKPRGLSRLKNKGRPARCQPVAAGAGRTKGINYRHHCVRLTIFNRRAA